MRNLKKFLITLVMLASVVGIAPAFGDDWSAVRLRGHVYALADGAWVQLGRGDIVSDDRVIRTAPNGRVVFERGGESIELGPDTTIQIQDRTGRQFTTVQQHGGEVTIIANVQDVEHFSVQTPFLAAVVKGTIFRVDMSDHDAEVVVVRGRVNVRDTAHGDYVSITQGQRAVGSKEQPLTASGNGVELVRHADGSVIQSQVAVVNVANSFPASNDDDDDEDDSAGGSAHDSAHDSVESVNVASSPATPTPPAQPATPANSNANANANSGGNSNSNNGNGGGNNGNGNGNSGGNNGNGNGNGGGNNGNGNGGGNNGNGNGNGGGNNGNGNGNGNGGGNNGNGKGNGGGNK